MLSRVREIFQQTHVSSQTQLQFDIPEGKYESLLFNFSGTADTGKTFDPTDVGELDIKDAFPLSRVQFSVLDDIAQLKGGIFNRTSNAGGAFDWWIKYPFAYFTDSDGIFRVASGELVKATLFYGSNLSTALGANQLTVKVYGVEKTGVQAYRLKIEKNDLQVISGRRQYPLAAENIANVFIENNTNLSRIIYRQDGEVAFDVVPAALENVTHDDNRIESFSSTFPLIELNFNRRDRMKKLKNDSNIIELESTASDTITVTTVSLDFTPDEAAATLAEDSVDSQNRTDRKARENKTRAVNINQLQV